MKYLIYLFIALLLTGCRASKKVTEQTQLMETEECVQDSGRVDVNATANMDRRTDELKTETEDLTVTITNFSPPDSTGNQYMTSTTTVQYNRKAGNKKLESSNLVQNTELEAEGTRNTAQGERTEQCESEHKEKPPERWPGVLLFLIALVTGFVVYRKLKRL